MMLTGGIWYFYRPRTKQVQTSDLNQGQTSVASPAGEVQLTSVPKPTPVGKSVAVKRTSLTVINYGYYTDGKNVYLEGDNNGDWKEIQGADPATFKVMDFQHSCRSVEKSYALFATDKNSVYCGLDRIVGADSASFVYIGSYDENPGGMDSSSGVASDKDCIYRNENPILDASGSCLNPSSCTSVSLAADPSSCGLK